MPLPFILTRVVGLWREDLGKTNPKAAQSLADPTEYENLFPEIHSALKAEQYLKKERELLQPAANFNEIVVSFVSDNDIKMTSFL